MNNQSSQGLFSILGGAIIALLILLVFNCFIIINPGQAGVLSVLGEAQDPPLLEGLHFRPPFISFVDVYDVTVQKFEVPAESLTKDLQDLNARFAINFRLDPQEIVGRRAVQASTGPCPISQRADGVCDQRMAEIAAGLRTTDRRVPSERPACHGSLRRC